MRRMSQWIAQEHRPIAGDYRCAVVEQAQVEGAEVENPPQCGIRGEQHLKSAIQHKTIGCTVRANAATDGVAGFDDRD